MTVGKRIKEAREKAGFSQRELGEKCGFEDVQSRVSNYERGKREPTLADLSRIAKHTGYDAPYLAFGNPDADPNEIRLLREYRLASENERRFLLESCDMIEAKRLRAKNAK